MEGGLHLLTNPLISAGQIQRRTLSPIPLPIQDLIFYTTSSLIFTACQLLELPVPVAAHACVLYARYHMACFWPELDDATLLAATHEGAEDSAVVTALDRSKGAEVAVQNVEQPVSRPLTSSLEPALVQTGKVVDTVSSNHASSNGKATTKNNGVGLRLLAANPADTAAAVVFMVSKLHSRHVSLSSLSDVFGFLTAWPRCLTGGGATHVERCCTGGPFARLRGRAAHCQQQQRGDEPGRNRWGGAKTSDEQGRPQSRVPGLGPKNTMDTNAGIFADDEVEAQYDAQLYYQSSTAKLAFNARIVPLETEILAAIGFDTVVALPHWLAVTYLEALGWLGLPQDEASDTDRQDAILVSTRQTGKKKQEEEEEEEEPPPPSPASAKALAQATVAHLNTALLSPQLLYLTHSPPALACAAIYCAAKDVGARLPDCASAGDDDDSDPLFGESHWWTVFDVEQEELIFLAVAMRSLEGWLREKVIATQPIPGVNDQDSHAHNGPFTESLFEPSGIITKDTVIKYLHHTGRI